MGSAEIIAIGSAIAAIIAAVVAALKGKHASNLEKDKAALEAERSRQNDEIDKDKETIRQWKEIVKQRDADRKDDREQRDRDKAELIHKVEKLQEEHLQCQIALATINTQMHDATKRIEAQDSRIVLLEGEIAKLRSLLEQHRD